MFGIGFGELLLIAVVALIFLGPDRLPEAARNVGKAIADVRRATEPARSAWTELTNELNSVTKVTGNPWTVHPVIASMTPEEREQYIAGGELPDYVAEEMARLDSVSTNGHGGESHEEIADLDYPMPHADPAERPLPTFSPPLEEVSYPPPGNGKQEEER